MKNLAIIPARSGSKGVTNKNIRDLYGKPLMAYSIEAAIKSKCFNNIMVSTDSELYASVARTYGAEVPFLRSAQTSLDSSSSWDAVDEVLRGYEDMGNSYDSFCLLQPTSPLRTADDIKNAYELLNKKNGFAVISMTALEHPIEWCGQIGESLSLNGFSFRKEDARRQQMATTYRPNGAIYVVKVGEFRKNRFLYRKGAYAYIMPHIRSVDIDTELDFGYAEYLMSRR